MPTTLTVQGVLFDLDGTLVDSTPAVKTTFLAWCQLQSLDPRQLFSQHNGTKISEVVKRYQVVPVPGSSLSQEELTRATEEIERTILENARKSEEEGGEGMKCLPGVRELLGQLGERGVRWGVVTSDVDAKSDTYEPEASTSTSSAPIAIPQSGLARSLASHPAPPSYDTPSFSPSSFDSPSETRQLRFGSLQPQSTARFRRDSLSGAAANPGGSSSANGGNAARGFRPLSVPTSSRFPMDESDEEWAIEDPEAGADDVNDDVGSPLLPGDELPAYAPRTPRAPPLPTKLHKYESRSGKLRLELTAAGEQFIIIQGSPTDGKTWLEGGESLLKVALPSSETITHVKIRIKGVVQTMVMRIHGSGRHPVNEEVLIWEDAATLWSADNPTSPEGNESADPTKLQGKLTFPFRLHLPSRVTIRTSAPGVVRKVRLPPSFVLTTDGGGAARADWASCKYFIKVTLGRKGLLKVNERISVPLVYLPKAVAAGGTILRMAALASGHPIPGPLDDPSGWSGKFVAIPTSNTTYRADVVLSGFRQLRHNVKKGLFTGRKAWYEVTVQIPTPSKFPRYTAIPFVIRITSSDPEITGTFPPSSLKVSLIQRAFVSAQGLSGTHDVLVAKAEAFDDGPAETDSLSDAEGAERAVWARRYRGTIQLNVGSSFKAPNLVVQFMVNVHVSVSGTGNDVDLSSPVEICPGYPTHPSVATVPATQPIEMMMDGVGIEGAEGEAPDPFGFRALSAQSVGVVLPPSYFIDRG
ncbi:hypothetical protein MNV49_006144 [Pseudohyphozyma bogoriensis]|nr:hypothetical protein MNV49_006144 [Pseudohyphozyma bogoriensis]